MCNKARFTNKQQNSFSLIVTADMDRQQIVQLKLIILLLVSVGVVYVNMDIVFMLGWSIMWGLIILYGRGIRHISKKDIKDIMIELMIFCVDLILGITVRIKLLLRNKKIQRNRKWGQKSKKVNCHSNRQIFSKNMKELMKAHKENKQTKCNTATQTNTDLLCCQNNENKNMGATKNNERLGAKPKHNIGKETKSTKKMSYMSEIFSSQEPDTKRCISCNTQFVVFFIGNTWLESNLCSLCRFDVRNHIYQIWCYSCKVMLLEKTDPSKGQNLCIFCRPAELKTHNYFQYIKCNKKNIEYFCACAMCLTGDIQGCKAQPCYKCSEPKPKLP